MVRTERAIEQPADGWAVKWEDVEIGADRRPITSYVKADALEHLGFADLVAISVQLLPAGPRQRLMPRTIQELQSLSFFRRHVIALEILPF